MTTKDRRRGRKETPYFMLVNRGLVQRLMCSINGHDAKCWPVARTHEDATRLANHLVGQHAAAAATIRPALIGSVPGETLEGHISMAIDEGCEYMLCPVGWANDEPVWGGLSLAE